MIGSSSSKVQFLRRRARRKSDKIIFAGWDDTKSSHFCVYLSSFLASFIEFFRPKTQLFCLKTQFSENTQRTSNILNALANQLFICCLYYIRYKFFSTR